jgi:uncharacterized protein (DUF1778 family)
MDEDFVEFCRRGIAENPPIRLTAEESVRFMELMENPPPPSPALILAIKKGRELMQGMRSREGRNS